MAANILEHLKKRKIATIVEKSKEKKNLNALKIMSIIDHNMESYGMYEEINSATPKLLKQLLDFKSFSAFHYWRYCVQNKFNNKFILMCRICKLIGPYHLILTHMATTHEAHHAAKTCNWCKKSDVKEHITNKTLEKCHKQYLQQKGITSTNFPKIIVKFYEMLRDLATALGVNSTRGDSYTARGSKRRQICFEVDTRDRDLDDTVILYQNSFPKTSVNVDVLNVLFEKVIDNFYGANRIRDFVSVPVSRIQQQIQTYPMNINSIEAISRNDDHIFPMPETSSRQATHSTNEQQNDNNQNLSAQNSSRQWTIKIGSMIDDIIQSLPNTEMKQDAILKIHSYSLEYLRKAYETRDNP